MSSFMRFLFLFKWLVFLNVTLLFHSAGVTSDVPAQIRHKNIIPQSVYVRVTERGQAYFEQNFPRVLFSLGFDISEGAFGDQSFDLEPLNYEQLAQTDPEKSRLLAQIRDVYTKYFVGPKWNEHRIRIRIGSLLYRAEIKRLGLTADRKALEVLGKRTGAVLRLEFEIPRLNIALKDLIVSDTQNAWLGEVGLRNGLFRLGDVDAPLRIVVPIYTFINSRGQLEFQAQPISNNLQDAPFDLQFQELLLPQIKIVFPSGEEARVNLPEIEKLLREQLPQLQGQIRGALSKWIQNDLPLQLNAMASRYLSNSVEQISSIPPISLVENENQRPLSWGLRLAQLQHRDDLEFWLSSFVEDSMQTQRIPLRADIEHAQGGVRLDHLSRREYDAGFGVSAAVLNRLVYMSYLRGNFQRISVGEENFLRATDVPTLELIEENRNDRVLVKIRSRVEVAVGASQASHFHNGILKAQGSFIVEFKPSIDRKTFEMSFVEIPLNELVLDEDSIRPPLLFWGKGIVVSRLQDLIKKQNEKWRTDPTQAKVDFTLPLPALMGINFQIKKLAVDSRQYLVVYAEYEKGGS